MNSFKLELRIPVGNMSSATCNGLLFPTLRDELQENLHCVKPPCPVQSLQTQEICQVRCKEGIVHVALYLALRDKLQEKLHCVVLVTMSHDLMSLKWFLQKEVWERRIQHISGNNHSLFKRLLNISCC